MIFFKKCFFLFKNEFFFIENEIESDNAKNCDSDSSKNEKDKIRTFEQNEPKNNLKNFEHNENKNNDLSRIKKGYYKNFERNKHRNYKKILLENFQKTF